MESLKKGATLCLPGLRRGQPPFGAASSDVPAGDPPAPLAPAFLPGKWLKGGHLCKTGSARKWPRAPHLTEAAGRGWLGSTVSPTSGRSLRVSHALAPSHRSFALPVPRSHLAAGFSTLIPRELDSFSRPPRVRGHPHPHSAAPSRPRPAQRPRPRGSRKGLGYLGPRARDSERQQLLLSRRSSASLLS